MIFFAFFQLNGDDEVKTENWIVKIPPNDKTDRQMAQMAQVDKREIHFYTEALPELEVGKNNSCFLWKKIVVYFCFCVKFDDVMNGMHFFV